ncbi:uncharacterized protein DUF4439 [Flavimobilis soli]|uniref:Uncharacterized protein DUF4439 n=1 Tax=Flavimobilis soli TaxID=442709 RepID=A0A2A9EBC1_9MICO|nr:ferritin-like domain-containing protein [Flavimobilis soli]PFG35946.1 uncharacterized protein DUF4439 [Flavimobilis soli]
MEQHQLLPSASRPALPRAAATLPGRVRRGLTAGRLRRLAAAAAVVAVLTGCGVRMETPSPTQPVPDAVEAARRAAVQDVVDVEAQARATIAALPADAKGDEKRAVERKRDNLQAILDDSTAHLAALGGQYVSGLLDADGVPLPAEPTPADAEPGSQQTVDRLVQSYARARGALATQEDDAVARLMASVAVAQLTRAQTLAAAGGDTLPETDAPASAQVPDALPEGVDVDADLLPLIAAEDAAGYAYEVLSARVTEAERVAARTRAAQHRARAEAWARLAEVDGTAQDPREVAYALPDGVLADPVDTSGLHALETGLATSYATLVAEVAPELRTAMLDLLTDSYGAALTWGATPVAFPGLPERASEG